MAQKIPIYGELDCRTAENIIADSKQIRYKGLNVENAIAEKMAMPLNEGTVGQVLKKTTYGSEWQNESGGTVKKIYAHSIRTTLSGTGLESGILYISILNNDNTPISAVSDIVGTKIIAVRGYYYNGTKDCIVYDVISQSGLIISYVDNGEKKVKTFASTSVGLTDTVTEVN